MLSNLRNRRLARRGICGIVVAAGCAMAAPVAQAQVMLWNNAAGGSAGTAANWNPVQVPGAANILNFNLAGNFAVSFPATVPTSAQHNYNTGTISLSTLAPHTATTQLVVGLNAASTPNVTLTAGSLSSSIIVVASNATSTSTLNINGPTADVFSTGANGVRVGSGGNGTLNITSGGSLRSQGAFTLALQAGSQGAATVSGLSGAVRSELVTLDAANGDMFIAQNGAGTLQVLLGGLVDIADDSFIAPTAGFTGSVTVGSTVATDSTFDTVGDLHIGSNLTAAAAGTGTLTINDGGFATVDGTTQIGDSAGGTGTLVMRDGGNLLTRSLSIDPVHGVLSHLGGAISVVGGTFTAPNNQLTMNGIAGDNPILSIVSGAQCTLSAPAGTRALTVATTERATVSTGTVGSVFHVASGDIVVGEFIGGSGLIQTQNSGMFSFANSGLLTVGKGGLGRIVFGASGRLSGGSVEAATLASGTSIINVSQSNATFDIAGTLALGGTMAAAGGTAAMTIGTASPNSGTVTVTAGDIPGGIGTKIWNGGSLTINAGGRLNSDRVVFNSGTFTLAGGTIDASNLVIASAGPNLLTGTIVRLMQPAGAGVATLSGPLSVGFLVNNGVINVGDHTLSIGSDGTPMLGNCDVGALGHVVCSQTLSLASGSVLSGSGAIDARLDNAGTITSTGTGLTLNGLVTGLGEGIGGTAIHFGTSGGFTGTGAFSSSTPVSAQAGSQITATGNLNLGSNSSSAGFASAGRIFVSGSSAVLLRDSDGAQVHDVHFVSGNVTTPPQVICSAGLSVTGVVSGTGTIGGDSNSPMQAAGATLTPGSSLQAGSIFLNADTVLGPTSTTEIDIFDAASHDEIRSLSHLELNPLRTVPGDITLDGTLVLRVSPTHTPVSGESHHIVVTNQGMLGPDGRIFGNFTTLDVPRHWLIRVVPNQSDGQENGVFAVYCTADFNEDGTVDFFDYLDFVDAFSSGDGTADFNADTTIDFFDYLDFVDAFSIGC